ncbi:hypothetical protein SAMN02745945_02064 [Peptoclostridium litorale DSM 5388]|uniref:Phosphatidylethanolamine-binding protein n=1 Tax=Peptoclostridium litorale DSM 5388 TaxID=1121324 RepID=A0A069RMT3_PEPLI|nr:YbhB/YbcL family Raf kinase inhibitor-like protein [Peptoclostridium litorale]KDR95492.1 hypothetical protein UPF0098 [Peptoclostridium litorale DSM 5388]SIO17545.1 hypothetical protein SAMN02745945_02064 [Peptoclostridium litorale DSM 5388]
MNIVSPAFENEGSIPSRYTCDGENISPELNWSDFPDGTKSFALIADDPDAPMGTWVHWVIYDIPSNLNSLSEGVPSDEILEFGAVHGINDFKDTGYGGPCPPKGIHRYFFKLYALDDMLNLKPGLTKKALLHEIKRHVLAQAQIYGKYSRI